MANDIILDTDERGVDYDLSSCLAENPQTFGVDDIARVLGCIEGENDEDDWYWLLELKDGRPALLTGWCDFTGWDCRSHADSAISSAPYGPWYCGSACDAFQVAHPDLPIPRDIIDELARQEAEGLRPTRREQIGKALIGSVRMTTGDAARAELAAQQREEPPE